MNEYAIYLRKSRKDIIQDQQFNDNDTLARHEKILLDLAKHQQLSIGSIYKEVVSGETIASRPVMQHLLSEVEDGKWAGVLVIEVERLARGDTIDQGIIAQAFKYSDTLIVTPTKTYDPNNEFDEEYFEFGLFMSRREFKTINRRMQRGKAAAIAEGKWVGNIPPYGYDIIKYKEGKGNILSPNSIEADVVKLIFELYTKGKIDHDGTYKRLGSQLIAYELNDLGVKPRNGGKWSMHSIIGILNNPVYTGQLRWGRRSGKKTVTDGKVKMSRPVNQDYQLSKGLHQPIIDENTFNLAQTILKSAPASSVPKGKAMQNPLSGLVYCGCCGKVMVRRPQKSLPDALICTTKGCKTVSSYLHLVEQRILDALADWLETYRLELSDTNDIQDNSIYLEMKQKQLTNLQSDYETLTLQTNNLYDLLEQGVYTTEVFLERTKILNDKKASIENDITLVTKDIEDFYQLKSAKERFIPQIERILEIYARCSNAEEKNILLSDVIGKVVYNKTERGNNTGKGKDLFEIVLYPHLPK